MPDNNTLYSVQLPDGRKTQWNQDQYDKVKDSLFEKYPDANVVRTSAYNPEDTEDTSDYAIKLPDGRVTSWTPEQFGKAGSQLMEKYPDAQVMRYQPVNYWGDKLTDIYDRMGALNKELGELPEEDSAADLRNMDDEQLMQAATETQKPTAKRRREINRELEDLRQQRENNPAWKAYWKQQNEAIDAEIADVEDRMKKLIKKNPDAYNAYVTGHSFIGGNGPSMAAGQSAIDRDPRFDQDYESLKAAKNMLKDAKRTASMPSKYGDESGLSNFWEGVKGYAPDAITPLALQKALLDTRLIDAIKLIQSAEGPKADIVTLVNEHPEYMGYLSDEQKELVRSFVKKAEIESGRADNMSRAYQAGAGAIQSAGFMADFALAGGIGDAAAKGAVKAVGLGSAEKGVAKFAADVVGASAKALAMTPLMPSSYSNFVNNLLTLDDAGGVDLSGKAIVKSIGDVLIENFSENAGNIALPFELKAADKIFGSTKFGDWAKAMRQTPFAQIMKQAGWNGLIGEMGEEWVGNALRVMTGVDKDALKDFATVEQQLITLGSFAPMTLFGGVTSTAQFTAASKAMKRAGVPLQKILADNGFDEEQISDIMKVSNYETPEELGHHMAKVVTDIANNGGDAAEAYKAVSDYTKAVSEYKVLSAVFEEQKDVERTDRILQIDQETGIQNWHRPGEEGETVRTLTDENGNEMFVLSEDEDGTIAVVDRRTGENRFVDRSVLDSGNWTDSGVVPLNDYLDSDIAAQKQISEEERIANETQAQLQKVRQQLQPGTAINIGTLEAPVNATIVQADANGITVATGDVNNPESVRNYSWTEAAALTGNPISVKTEAELEDEQAEDIAQKKARKDEYNSKLQPGTVIEVPTMLDGENMTPVQYEFQRALIDEGQLQFVVRDPVTGKETLVSEEEALEGNLADVLAGTSINESPAVENTTEEQQIATDESSGPKDFRGNNIPLKEDGSVNQTAFWNNDPEAWAKWNDERRQDGGANSIGYINKALKKLAGDRTKLQKQLDSETDFDKIDAIEQNIADIDGRARQLEGIISGYQTPAAESNSESPALPSAQSEEASVPFGVSVRKELQEKLNAINDLLNIATTEEEKAAVMELKAAAIQETIDKIKTDDATVATTSNILDILAKDGVSEKDIEAVKKELGISTVNGFRVKGKIYIIAESITSASHAIGTYVHERQHRISSEKEYGKTVAEMLGNDRNRILDFVLRFTGGDYSSYTSNSAIAEEIVSRAMEIAYISTPENLEENLRKYGLDNEEIINFVKSIDNEQRNDQSLAAARRDTLQRNNAESIERQDGRDSQTGPAGDLGQQGRGSFRSGEGRTGEGEAQERGNDQSLSLSGRDTLLSRDTQGGLGQDGRNSQERSSGNLERPGMGSGESGQRGTGELQGEQDGREVGQSADTGEAQVGEQNDTATPQNTVILESEDNNSEESNTSSETIERLDSEGIAANGDEVRFSVRYVPTDDQQSQIVDDIVSSTGVSKEKAEQWLKSETSLAALILNEENEPYLNYTGDDRYKAIKQDSDYPQGTVDFNNICRKRLPFTQMYQRIQKAFPNTIITGSDLATIRQIMKDHGITVACGLCYVEDRRQLLGEIATSFIDEMKGGFKNYAKGSEAKRRNAEKFRKLLGDDTKEDLSIYDLITLEGSSRLAQEHPGIYQAFQTFNAARGQQAGNLFQGYAEYKREILKWNKKKVASVNANGGLRIFSYSDFEAHHLIDLVQIIQDCARKGVMIQGYTKVPAFARAVANTGIKLNRSLIPLGDTGTVDGQLAYDPVEGIDINDKDFLPDNDNIGNILIGINDEQIRLAMADPFVHYIIPYHSNQSGVLRQMKQTGAWTNYKNEQTEKGQNVGHGVNIYTDVLAPAEAEGNPIKNEREFVERFLQVCKEKGWTPRFARFLNTDENGDYLYTPGYYKLLLDFKLFDADGNILPQRPVVAEFDDEFNKSILEDYVRGERGNADESLDDVYNEIVSKLGLSDREADIRRTNAESDRLTSMLNSARALREANATQKQPVSAERTQEPVSTTDAEESIMFSLSRNNRATIQSWLNKREDLTDEQRSGVMDYLDGLKDSKTQLATARWFVNGTIRIPEDMKKVEQAIYVAGRAKVDPLRYSSPMELLEAHAEFKPKEERINPDEVSTLHRAAEYPDQGIVVYDVDNTEESRRNMRKIINTHFGEDASPWCLLQGDGKGNLTTDSKRYWRHYSAYPKQVAFRDGKLLAFSANDTHTRVWWDRQDQSHYGIPMLLKVPGDELGRSADHIIDENGNLIIEPGAHMYRGNKQNGVYEEWSADGETLLQRAEYKDGVENGVTEQWYPSGQLWRRTGMKNGEYAGTYEMWYENGQQRLIVEFDENGDRHGTQRGWYKDGKLHQEFHYNHGQFDGEQRDYDDDGNLSSVRRYNNGNLVGFEDHGPFGIEKRVTYTSDSNNHRVVELFRRNGNLSERAEYDGTTLNGVREIYNADGGIQTRANYVYGDRNGLFETYHPNGKLWVRGEYKFGNRDGIHEQWDKDGNLISRVEFRNDEKVRDLPLNTPAIEDVSESEEDQIEGMRFSKVTNPETLDKLNNSPTFRAYRAMAFIEDENGDVEADLGDGKGMRKGRLYSPMATQERDENGRWRLRQPTDINAWEQADEHPEKTHEKNGKWVFTLKKPDGSTVDAAYNPYIHTSLIPLNDQFTAAHKRPELVTVEVEVPESELTSGYKAEKAKDPVGKMPWHSGPVAGQLPEGKKREVVLSRYDRPVRVVPNSEVADMIVEAFEGVNHPPFPWNVFTPTLREELSRRGVEFSSQASGTVSREDQRAYERSINADGLTNAQRSVLDFVNGEDSGVRYSKSVFTPTDKGRDESSMNYAMRIAYGFDTAYNTGSRGWEFENGEGQESSMAYSRKTKKIHIFVKDQMPSGEEMEMLCFHESLHAWMDRMPAREKEQLVSDYNDADFFVNPGTKELVYEGIRNRKYRDEDVPEEYLTHTLSQAMEIGMTQRILDEMPDASRDLLQGLFNSIDYNVEEESNRRRAQRNGGVREGTSTESGERADLRNSVAERAGEGGAREGREQVEDSVRFSKTTSNEELFDKAKERFGTTRDIREAGYVLPDGTMLDFSGRHMASGDTSYLNGGRTVDHRDIEDLNFESDLNTPSGIETNMPDFIRRGAIRIDSNGLINLSVKPTKSQESVLRRLISRNGFMAVDFGDGNSTRAYAEYDRPNAERILGDISDYFDYGIKPEGDSGLRFSKSAIDELNDEGVSVDNTELLDKYSLSNATLTKNGDVVTINKVVASEKGNGNGTRFMNDLTNVADQNGWTLALTPDDSFGASSINRLKKFYKRFGFKYNKGRNTDFSIRESMIRVPSNTLMFSKTSSNDENGDPINFESTGGLPEKSGRTSLVERTYRKTGAFSFTGKDKIESAADVAYIFKELETSATENSFIVFVKDGKPTILHTGIGTIDRTEIDSAPMVAGLKDFAPDMIYMVHNHPSGRVEASTADGKELDRLQGMAGDIQVQGIIIDTVTGEYGVFDRELGSTIIDNRSGEEANAIPLEVLTFDRMVFAPEYRSEIGKSQIANAESVAAYLSAHRLGDGEKVGALLLNRANQVVGNLVFNDNVLTEDNAESLAGDAVDAAVRSAASSVIIYGDMSADKKTIWSFKNSIDRIGGGNVRWLDAVKVEGNHTKSLAEWTLMDDGENKSEILSHVNDRLDQISRISQTPSSISKTGNQGEIIPTETGGREGVESDTNVGNNIDIPNQLVKKTADFINQLTYDNSIDANNYIEKLINALGYKVMNQHSGYVRFENKDGESVFLRLSDHRAHARNQIGIKSDNKYSIAILVDSSPEVRFRPSRRVRMVEYVYDHPDNERLVNITKSIFNLFDSGRYVDLANANETNTSPNPNAVLRDIAAEDSELRFSKSVETVQEMDRNGLGSVIGEDNVNDFYNEAYRIANPEIRRNIAERAEAYGYNFREATKDYLAGLAMAGYQNDDTGMLRAVAGLLNGYAADGIGIDENSLRYILWKQGRSDNGEILNIASDIAMRRRLGVGEFADPIRFSKAHTENLSEAAENVRSEYDTAIEEAKQTLDEKKKVLKGNLITLAKAMAIQREYDQNTVDSLVKLVKQLMREGGVDSLTAREMGRMLGLINHSVGKKNLTKNANALMDVVIDNLMKKERDAFEKLLNIKGSKVNAKGVEVQGKLDIEGQRVVKAVKAGLAMTEDEVKERMNDLSDRMDSNDDTIAEEAKAEYAGLQLALDYHSSITDSIGEETGLENERNDAMTQRREGKMTKQAFDEFMKDVDSSMRENHIERVEAFRELRTKLVSILSGSIDAAKEFREREKERIENIHHLANSDMQGISSDEHVRDDKNFWQRLSNSSIVRFLMSPLASFDQMLRLFGSKNINGEGYLWNKFHRGWVEATENEYTGMKEATRELDEKVSSVFGKEMMWSDLYEVERKMPKVTVKFWDGGQMKDHELTQGNLLYIYMVNKMSDGRMKLRRMGIEEEDVQAIVRQMDPRFIELADWLQNEYLVNKRNKYNAVHERMFGASMAAIDNYFPIKILSNARTKEEDVSNMNDEEALPSTTTGSIIKRRRNSLALDVLGSDAFSVVIEHLEQMEHWAAFAEFNRDINTLLSYKRFRNQVQNMDSVYGSGKKLWNNFKSVCRIAAGTYRPSVKAESLDTAAMNVAKGVTAAKISFRVYTALKQFLSMPAFIADANVKYLAENMATPWKSWNWAMENLPIFEKRWKSRQAGDTRLMQTDSDWKLWRNKIIEKASQWGMSPNAFVDALTVSIGAHAMYQTKYDKYIKAGYSEEQADKKAKQDATTLYNETQQSSEGAFVSPVQLDRTVFSVMITVFRNSSMGYQRQLHDAVRNIGKMMKSGYKEESIAFMKKQMMRDGLTEEQAQHAAEREYGNALAHNATRIATFGFLVQFAWNLGGSLAYLLLGDDDDEKEKMLEDAARKGLIGGTIEGLAGGNVASEALDMLAKGESLQNYDPSLLPIFSDMKRVYQMMGYDKVAAANELVNLAIQAGIGVNPQTLTDAIVAVEDACGGDLDTSKEAMLLIMRVLQVPQSQIDKIYIDELGVNAGEAQKMTYGEMAERYANYKVERGAPLTGWAYQGELENKREKAYLKRFKKMVKERNENKQ